MIKNTLDKLTKQAAPGPSLSFSSLDILRAIDIIGSKGPIGRHRLSEELDIGEGAVRTLIRRLSKSGLITASKLGVSATEKGNRMWRDLTSIMPKKTQIQVNEISSASFNVAVLLKSCGERVGNGLPQRDAAVRAGCGGATTIVFRNDKLAIPAVSSDLEKDFPEAAKQIMRRMNPEENDIIIIAAGKTLKEADKGALAAALTLL